MNATATTIYGDVYSVADYDNEPMREDESILGYEARLVEMRVGRCGIYDGARFCDCGNPFVNHPPREER